MSIIQSEKLGLKSIGIKDDLTFHRNLSVESLVDDIISNEEGILASTGAAMVDTGKYTGRSPKDKDIVDENSTFKSQKMPTIKLAEETSRIFKL